MSRLSWIRVGAVLALGALVLTLTFRDLGGAQREFERQATLARQEAERIRAEVLSYSKQRIARGLTFSRALADLGIEPVTAAEIIGSAQRVFDLRRIRAGNLLEIGRSVEGELRDIRYQIDGERILSLHLGKDGFEAELQLIPTKTETLTVHGEIDDSLFNAVTAAGENPELAIRLADIFGWDLDFYADPRRGDTFRVLVEKKRYLNGEAAGYGCLLAAEYINDGRAYTAVLFHDDVGNPAYYAADGSSLQKVFLRSPLKFSARVTSRFSTRRFHPILKRHRPHLGVDYGAPTGTPVQAIGAGRVTFAGRKGGNGNTVEIQHANGYKSMYLHLSRVLVRSGQRVETGSRIGLVGSTGLATGPHLDFRISYRGAFRNFEVLRRSLPPSEPVAPAALAQFSAVRDHVLSQLDSTLQTRSVEPDSIP